MFGYELKQAMDGSTSYFGISEIKPNLHDFKKRKRKKTNIKIENRKTKPIGKDIQLLPRKKRPQDLVRKTVNRYTSEQG